MCNPGLSDVFSAATVERPARGHRRDVAACHSARVRRATWCAPAFAMLPGSTGARSLRNHRGSTPLRPSRLPRLASPSPMRPGASSGDHPPLAVLVGAAPVPGVSTGRPESSTTPRMRWKASTRGSGRRPRRRGRFPNERAVRKVLYLVIRTPLSTAPTSPARMESRTAHAHDVPRRSRRPKTEHHRPPHTKKSDRSGFERLGRTVVGWVDAALGRACGLAVLICVGGVCGGGVPGV